MGLYARLGENLLGSPNATIINDGGPGVIIAPDQFFMAPYRGGGGTTAHKIIRAQANSNLLPVSDVRDVYSGSGAPQTCRSVLTRYRYTDSGAYHFKANASGEIVSNFRVDPPAASAWSSGATYAADAHVTYGLSTWRCQTAGVGTSTDAPGTSSPTDGYSWSEYEGGYFECIVAHDPADVTTAEPGKGADWKLYWERLQQFGTNSVYGSPNSAKWDAGYGTYAARITVFTIRGGGQIHTNQSTATATVGAQTNRMPIYDTTGTLIGYIPIYAAS